MPNLLSDTSLMCCSSVEATREADMHAFPKTGAVAAGARRGTLIGWKAGCANPLDRSVATFAANNEGEPMGLSDGSASLPSSRLSALRVSSTRLRPAPLTTEH